METFFKIAGVLFLISILIVLSLTLCLVWDIEYSLLIPKIGATITAIATLSLIIGFLLTFKD